MYALISGVCNILETPKKKKTKTVSMRPPSSSGPMTALLFAMPVGLSLP
jgi:hypothetical protein